MPVSKYRFQEINQNFTPLSACQFNLDDGLVVEVVGEVLSSCVPISIARLTTLSYNNARYYLFFMRPDNQGAQLLSPVMPDYDPNVPYLGTLTIQPQNGYPNNGGSIQPVYLVTDLDSLLTSFMDPYSSFQKTSTDGSITAKLVMIPEGTMLDSSMNIMKNLYPDAYLAYNAFDTSSPGTPQSLSGNVSTYTFQDLGNGLGQTTSSFQFILDNSFIIPVTNGMLGSPSIGAYYLSLVVYNSVRYFLFVLDQSSNTLMPLMIDLDPFKPINTVLAPQGINGYPDRGGSVTLLFRNITQDSVAGGLNKQVSVSTSLPSSPGNPGATYTAPLVAIPEFALTSQFFILGSVYPEVAVAFSNFTLIDFDPNQNSPNPCSLNVFNSRASCGMRNNRNLIPFLIGVTIGIAIIVGSTVHFKQNNNENSIANNQQVPVKELTTK